MANLINGLIVGGVLIAFGVFAINMILAAGVLVNMAYVAIKEWASN